jgi:hypothetical protein
MQKVNVLYADEFNDADIILIPDRMVNDINKIEHDFDRWLQTDQNTEFWSIASDGKNVLIWKPSV